MSKLARLLEEAAATGNTDRLRRVHPVLSEEIDRHYDRLRTLFPENEETMIKDEGELWTYLSMLRSNLEQHELNASDMLVRELANYAKGSALEKDMAELKQQVDNLEFEEAVSVAERIIRQLKGGAQ